MEWLSKHFRLHFISTLLSDYTLIAAFEVFHLDLNIILKSLWGESSPLA